MRKPRENKHNRVYHLISRIAHRAFFLSADERDRFIDIMKRSAAFSGVRLLAWCVMTNHVHILVYVPEPEELSDDALLSRMRTLYRKSRFAELKRLWDQLAARPGTQQFARFRGSFLKRMWNAGEFMKTLKQHFTMSYNSRRVHAGTMWEGRYHVRIHKPDDFGMGGAAMLTAGYIDVNPLKAKIVSSVESVSDYRWGSYHEACMGDADAVCGYDVIYGGTPKETVSLYTGIIGKAVSFETTDTEGNIITSEDLFSSNKITMINIWASWCGPCIRELPELQAISERLKEKNCGVIGLLYDGDGEEALETAKKLMTDNGVSYPVILPPENVDSLFPLEAFPTTYFVDSEGKIVSEPIVGAYVDQYETTVDALLAAE